MNTVEKARLLVSELMEGFKEAKAKFIAAGADPAAVDETIAQFKQLKARHMLGPVEGDIDSFADFARLQQVVADAGQRVSGKQKRKETKLQGAVLFKDSPEHHIVVPHTREAAVLYGKGTKWCVSSVDSNTHFATYRRDLAKHYMLLNKKKTPYDHATNQGDPYYKIAVTIYPDGRLTFHDARDTTMDAAKFQEVTGLDAKMFKAWDWKEMPNLEKWKVAKKSGVKFSEFLNAVDPEAWDELGVQVQQLKSNWIETQKKENPQATDEELNVRWPEFWRSALKEATEEPVDKDYLDVLQYYIDMVAESKPAQSLANSLLEGKLGQGQAKAFICGRPA